MRYTECGEIKTSLLGFGCGAVMGRVDRATSLRAMHLAWDAGVTFFDTARSYGYGEAETVLGDFLSTRPRAQAIVSTKFGILPQRPSKLKQLAKPAVRALLQLMPAARGLVRRGTAGSLQGGHFSVEVLRTSLEESLRQLRTDYVDLLFLHEAPPTALAMDDLMAELESLQRAGKIRRAGASCDTALTRQLMQNGTPPAIRSLQFAASIFELDSAAVTAQAAARGTFLVANHLFGGANGVANIKAKLSAISADATLPADLRSRLADTPLRTLLPEVVFGAVLRGTGIHTIVPSMLHEENLRANLAAIESTRFSDEEITLLRNRLL